MDELLFIELTAEYADEIMAYRRECLDAGSSMDGCGPLRRCETAEEFFKAIEQYKNPDTVPEGKVQATHYACVRRSDGKLVGILQLRHRLNEYLAKYAGHIGYSVRPSERRKGYAKYMLKSALSVCRGMGLTRVMVCCFEENEASRRTILSAGGVYERTELEPNEQKNIEIYWINI